MYFFLIGTVETMHKINFFFYLLGKKIKFFICAYSTIGLLMSKKELKGKGIMGCHPFLSLYAIIFSVSSWLIQGSKKGYNRISGCLYFLEC